MFTSALFTGKDGPRSCLQGLSTNWTLVPPPPLHHFIQASPSGKHSPIRWALLVGGLGIGVFSFIETQLT